MNQDNQDELSVQVDTLISHLYRIAGDAAGEFDVEIVSVASSSLPGLSCGQNIAVRWGRQVQIIINPEATLSSMALVADDEGSYSAWESM